MCDKMIVINSENNIWAMKGYSSEYLLFQRADGWCESVYRLFMKFVLEHLS